MSVEKKAPKGKTRVVCVDLFTKGDDCVVGDYTEQTDAFKIADDHNKSRRGSMDDVYYVYDDQGCYIRGNEAVGQKVSP